MPNQTVLIVAAVLIIWLVLFIPFMIMNKKRQEKSKSFTENNKDHALIHLFCKDIRIDGKDISAFNHTTGESLEKIVALTQGEHSFEGVFEASDINMLGKTINLKSDKLEFSLDLEAGHKYTVGMYLKSDTEVNDSKAVLTIPLSLYKGSENIKAYVICYKES